MLLSAHHSRQHSSSLYLFKYLSPRTVQGHPHFNLLSLAPGPYEPTCARQRRRSRPSGQGPGVAEVLEKAGGVACSCASFDMAPGLGTSSIQLLS